MRSHLNTLMFFSLEEQLPVSLVYYCRFLADGIVLANGNGLHPNVNFQTLKSFTVARDPT